MQRGAESAWFVGRRVCMADVAEWDRQSDWGHWERLACEGYEGEHHSHRPALRVTIVAAATTAQHIPRASADSDGDPPPRTLSPYTPLCMADNSRDIFPLCVPPSATRPLICAPALSAARSPLFSIPITSIQIGIHPHIPHTPAPSPPPRPLINCNWQFFAFSGSILISI